MTGVEVTQADIDKAAEYLAALLPEMPMLAERVKANGAGLARFFAEHRHEARSAALEEAAKVAEEHKPDHDHTVAGASSRLTAGAIAETLRSLSRSGGE